MTFYRHNEVNLLQISFRISASRNREGEALNYVFLILTLKWQINKQLSEWTIDADTRYSGAYSK